MKNLISILALILFCWSFTETKAQTMKYKEIYSMIKSGKTNEALPHLVVFLKDEPKHDETQVKPDVARLDGRDTNGA